MTYPRINLKTISVNLGPDLDHGLGLCVLVLHC